ncbi:hypothetical protein Rcae01_00714 [Novipirellula caenicola]|uniref:GTP cyclohydrolase I n=1 Tax=Novipirellula caenicola TaxID=1536901 RepID=A0ABP9VKZ3_9BACT
MRDLGEKGRVAILIAPLEVSTKRCTSDASFATEVPDAPKNRSKWTSQRRAWTQESLLLGGGARVRVTGVHVTAGCRSPPSRLGLKTVADVAVRRFKEKLPRRAKKIPRMIIRGILDDGSAVLQMATKCIRHRTRNHGSPIGRFGFGLVLESIREANPRNCGYCWRPAFRSERRPLRSRGRPIETSRND